MLKVDENALPHAMCPRNVTAQKSRVNAFAWGKMMKRNIRSEDDVSIDSRRVAMHCYGAFAVRSAFLLEHVPRQTRPIPALILAHQRVAFGGFVADIDGIDSVLRTEQQLDAADGM